MKHEIYAVISIVIFIAPGCNKGPIRSRKVEVNVDANHGYGQIDYTAQITKARIEADQYWMRIQLAADKKQANAGSTAETAREDSEK